MIADAIETSVNGQMMDGALVVGACDKNMPGGMMAIARINVPAIYVYGGTIKPGNWKGQDLTMRVHLNLLVLIVQEKFLKRIMMELREMLVLLLEHVVECLLPIQCHLLLRLLD